MCFFVVSMKADEGYLFDVRATWDDGFELVAMVAFLVVEDKGCYSDRRGEVRGLVDAGTVLLDWPLVLALLDFSREEGWVGSIEGGERMGWGDCRSVRWFHGKDRYLI